MTGMRLRSFCAYTRLQMFLAALLCLIAMPACAVGVHHKTHWPRWEQHNPLSTASIRHDAWQSFLEKYLVTDSEGITRIDYQRIHPDDKALLKGYLNQLSKTPVSTLNRREQLAFWINLYNALTVYVVSTHYPVDSIEDIHITPGLFSIGPWGAMLIRVEGIPLTLEDIQNRIIRPVWNDPRTHYALNNGTLGAPNLSREIWQGEKIDKQLTEAAKRFINSARGVQIADGQLVLSSLYAWYNEDFGDGDAAITTHLAQFANPALKAQLRQVHQINSYFYNWHLNTVPAS